jgi:hypothetical protein
LTTIFFGCSVGTMKLKKIELRNLLNQRAPSTESARFSWRATSRSFDSSWPATSLASASKESSSALAASRSASRFLARSSSSPYLRLSSRKPSNFSRTSALTGWKASCSFSSCASSSYLKRSASNFAFAFFISALATLNSNSASWSFFSSLGRRSWSLATSSRRRSTSAFRPPTTGSILPSLSALNPSRTAVPPAAANAF